MGFYDNVENDVNFYTHVRSKNNNKNNNNNNRPNVFKSNLFM